MTKSQENKVERIRRNFFNKTSYSNPERYEYKKFEVSENIDSPLVFVYAVTGMKEDEGTMAAVCCRFRGHFMIGKKGGIKVLSMESGTRDIEKKYRHLYY